MDDPADVVKEHRPLYPNQDENGVDLASLRANLKLTPTQRIEKMSAALAQVMELRRAAYEAGLRRNP